LRTRHKKNFVFQYQYLLAIGT